MARKKRIVKEDTPESVDEPQEVEREPTLPPEDKEEHEDSEQDKRSEVGMEEDEAESSPKAPPAIPLPPQLSQPVTQHVPPPEDVVRPRLVISKMILKNFKSYAGSQEIGPFHKSFSSVVGPNGSGKSNVIDALLFVFGYRANKMRQGKLSELIHNSAKHKNLDMCAVEVHFLEILDLPGPDNYEVVPNSTLIVSRQAFRNNSNKYFINGRTSNFTEVTTLLRDRGIDLDHKRFLILQGEVESISLMKPKAKDEHDEGLLEYLEDIIGTSIYNKPIENASEEVEKLNEERSERVNRVKFVEKEKQSLEGKKLEAEEYLRNENELAKRKNTLYQLHIAECSTNAEISRKSVNDLKEKLQSEQDKHGHIKDEVKKLEEEYNETVKEYETIGKETNEVLKELAKYEREDVQLQERKKHLKTKQKKVAKALEKDNHGKAENQSWITNHEEELEKRKSELEQLEKALIREEKELDSIRDGLKGKTEVFSSQIETKQKELAPWTEKINAKQSAIDVAQSEYDILFEKTQAAQRAAESADAEVAELKEAAKTKEEEVVRYRQDIERTKKEVISIEANLTQLGKQEEHLRGSLSAARQKADEAKASLSQSQSRGSVLTSLMRMRDSGRIKGIHGRLGDLGVIDDKYDVAISTACPALENIVVETVEIGQTCIEYLRKNNLGRAIFILLKELTQRDMSPIQTPENVHRLFDLVRPKEPKFAPAFYNVLQNTLVANNLEQANRIAYGKQRWRVVTLDGQLIDKSGTMSGGGTRVVRGGMSSKFAADDIKPEIVASFERERDNLETEWKTFVDRRRELQRQLEEKKEEIPQMQLSLSKLEMDVKSSEKRIADAKKRANDLRLRNKPNPEDSKRMSLLEAEITAINRDMEKLKTQSSKIAEDIKDLQNKILEVGGVRLRSQKAKVDGIREQIDTLNDRITKTQVARTKSEKDLKKAEAAVVKGEQELENIKVQLEELNAEIEEKTQAALEVREQADHAKELMDEKKEGLEEMKKSLDKNTNIINRIRAVEVEIRHELEEQERNLVDNEKKAVFWREQLKKLSLQKVGDDEDEMELELREYTPDELAEQQSQKQQLNGDIARLEELVENAKPNLSVLDEYRRRQEEYLERAKDLQEITSARDAVKKQHDDLRKRRLDEFMNGFNIISQKLKEMYQMITLGGNAELELVDSLDPFSEGIVFSVMPPKKSWKNISNLSGGEKTLSSLALVFALHHYKPTPLYVMDEIDAALDFRNVSIVANYIKDRTKNAQFVIISLRNNMFELADRLVGIYKTENCTKSIAINPGKVLSVSN